MLKLLKFKKNKKQKIRIFWKTSLLILIGLQGKTKKAESKQKIKHKINNKIQTNMQNHLLKSVKVKMEISLFYSKIKENKLLIKYSLTLKTKINLIVVRIKLNFL